ncbi:LPD29 domain-containing protein [Rossellomorea marisflavi]|uniref:LPD29 domain-containing protein n=1 Tax=Rossellomorea marisflavi TaxID=189381 RepID=UPI00345C7083
MTAVMKINEELNGIELYFASKPAQTTLTDLKSNGFRWSGRKKCWYAKQSDNTYTVAISLVGNDTIEEVTAAPKATKTVKKATLSLWESTRFEGIEVSEEMKNQDAKTIAKEIRTHVRKRFPQVKFSVRAPYYREVSIEIKSSPYEKGSNQLNAVKAYVDSLVSAYRVCYDRGDAYSDIPASYNFHFFETSADYDYVQTEVTEEVKKDMENFDQKLNEYIQAEEEKKEAEFQAYMEEKKAQDKKYEEQAEKEENAAKLVNESIEVKELTEDQKYFVIGSEFANLNKNNSLLDYQEEVLKGDYVLQDVKIDKEIHFTNEEALTNFSNMLLTDFDFLAGTGGSFTEDNRINSMTDFYNMDEEEKETVKWYLNGVGIYFNGKLQYIVDAQGHNYARYVGLIDNAKIQKSANFEQVIEGEELGQLKQQAETLEDYSTMILEELNLFDTWKGEGWKTYKTALITKINKFNLTFNKSVIQQIDIEDLKAAFYKILNETDGIQEQFNKADLQEGDKVTMFYISDWGSIVTSRMTISSVKNEPYAQYKDAVRVTYKPQKKKSLFYTHFYSNLLVYRGWHSLPVDVLHTLSQGNGFQVTKSKYHSCDLKQFDEILNHFKNQELNPVVNTYKPQF